MINNEVVRKRNARLRRLEVDCVNYYRQRQALEPVVPEGSYMRKAFRLGWEAAMRKAKKDGAMECDGEDVCWTGELEDF